MNRDRLTDIEDELEMKAGENNRLRKQVADLEKAMQDLYCSRKGNGSLQIELDSLKQDNERLLNLLKETTEYGDMDENEIQSAALKSSLTAGRSTATASTKSRKGSSAANELTQGGPKNSKEQKNNDWIPTQAVRAIL